MNEYHEVPVLKSARGALKKVRQSYQRHNPVIAKEVRGGVQSPGMNLIPVPVIS